MVSLHLREVKSVWQQIDLFLYNRRWGKAAVPEKDRVVGHADILYVFVNHGFEGLEQLGMI